MGAKLKIKIDLKRTGEGSTIIDAETGKPIDGVKAVTIRCGIGEPTTISLEFAAVEIEGEVEGIAV